MDGVFMKFKRALMFFAIVCAALTVSAAALQNSQNRFSDKLIRLHVVANSDDPSDQRLKLMVRDAVLSVTEPLLQGSEDPEKCLLDNLSVLQTTAEDCLRANGCLNRVEVSLGMEEFPARDYDYFSLPAGYYKSLRITIGDGQGHNWWCVVFPSICMRSASDFEAVAA